MILPLVYYGNKKLRTRCESVGEITSDLCKLVADMIETMDAKNGIGIAAPQVGHLLRLFVVRDYIELEDGKLSLSAPKVYINPKLSRLSEETCIEKEGCLSIPGLREEVERPLRIRIEALNLQGELFMEELEGYNARSRMHENDHLNGVLYIDRIDAGRRKKIEPMLKLLERKYKQSSVSS